MTIKHTIIIFRQIGLIVFLTTTKSVFLEYNINNNCTKFQVLKFNYFIKNRYFLFYCFILLFTWKIHNYDTNILINFLWDVILESTYMTIIWFSLPRQKKYEEIEDIKVLRKIIQKY